MFKANREFTFDGEKVKGYDAAIERLTQGAKAFSSKGPVKAEREATIILGPPASGKSRLSECKDERAIDRQRYTS